MDDVVSTCNNTSAKQFCGATLQTEALSRYFSLFSCIEFCWTLRLFQGKRQAWLAEAVPKVLRTTQHCNRGTHIKRMLWLIAFD